MPRLWFLGIAIGLLGCLVRPVTAADSQPARKKIVLLAGKKSHGPIGNGIHDYGWSVRLLKVMLDNSNIKDHVQVEVHLDGWPRDPRTLEDAATIMVISDGRDGNLYEEAPHLASEERVRLLDGLIKKGCGFVTFHFSTFAPEKYRDRILDWSGGYFQWEQDGKRQWHSAITTREAEAQIGTADHPIARGLKPFRLREEFYYNLRFPPKGDGVKPILVVPALGGRESDGNVVAWARERPDGGRGFGTTCGHFYDNWKNDAFRKLMLNAIAWTAKAEVPRDGVQARYFTHEEINQALGDYSGEQPIRVLMFAGNAAHKWHNWEKTTPAVKALLERDPRIRVDVSSDIEDLARKKLADYHVLVQNYANWHDPQGLSDAAKAAFVKFLQGGGGLIVLHFANGAFHPSLPKAEASDWPEYRRIVRRVWDHSGKDARSGHDPFGRFDVAVTNVKHPITEGLKSFEIEDELYFNQAGKEPIEPLLTGRSRVTQRDEPLAFAYTYGKGRIFQTLLGHSEKTYDALAVREVLRRAVAWVASRDVRPIEPAKDAPKPQAAEPLGEGRFGKALDARVGLALAAGKPDYQQPPLTIECWARLFDRQPYNILIASETKAAPTHWELFTMVGNGRLTAYLPGMLPDHVHSEVDVCDGKWHYLAMVYEAQRVRLYVDARQVAEQAVRSRGGMARQSDGLAVGAIVERTIFCNGLIDEVRMSRGARAIKAIPAEPFTADEQTLSLWRLDAVKDGTLEDAGRLKNAARVSTGSPNPSASPMPPDGVNYRPVDPGLKAVLIDRSPDDVYMGLKLDTEGRIFVGGREAVFVFEPDSKGGYTKRTLLRFPADSIIIGLELRGNDLYVLADNALYLVPDGRVKREGLKPRRLLWGLPLDLHVSFHCLAWGPEGDLYLNHGDPLLNHGDWSRPDHWGHWTLHGPDGAKTTYTGVGAVLRMRPDGTSLKVVSTGYRGPVGLAFDRHWNLFTNDNDHESRADLYAPARLMHVTPHSDFAWPRGWMASKSPERHDLLEPMIATLGRGVPCGLAYYDEPLLGDALRNSLLMARWDSFALTRYPLVRRGASFATKEHAFLEGRNLARPVGVATGRGGRVFTTVLYLAGNPWSPHCVSDLAMVTRSDDPADAPFQPYDIVSVPAEQLWKDLSSPSWDRRCHAHQEILRRGGPLLADAAKRLAMLKSGDPAALHLPWLAATAASKDARKVIGDLFLHDDPSIRLQGYRVLTAFPGFYAPDVMFGAWLTDPEPAVRLQDLARFFDAPADLPFKWVSNQACADDTYLRQTATRLLARRASLKDIARLIEAPEKKERLAGVMTAGVRLTVPASDFVPPAEVKLTYTHGNAQFVQRFADADGPVDLRSHARIGSFTTAQWWQAIKPNAEQAELFAVLQKGLEDREPSVQLQAAYYLGLLRDPRTEPGIARVRLDARLAELEKVPVRELTRTWAVGPFPDGDKGLAVAHTPESGAIDLTATYATPAGMQVWQEERGKDGRFRPTAVNKKSSSYLYFRLTGTTRQAGLLTVEAPGGLKVWLNGALAWRKDGAGRLMLPLDLQPGSNDVLIRAQGGGPLELSLRLPTAVQVGLPEKLDSALLAQRLREAAARGDAEKIGPEFLQVDWVKEIAQGNAAQGRQLFGSLGCVKCHGVTADQQAGGAPNLADARKRFTVPHLVESVLLPSKQVAEPFRASILTMKNGQSLTGFVVNETKDTVELLVADGTRKAIARGEIEERQLSQLSPMPADLVRTPRELRDLLAYLLSDNPLPP